MPGKRNRPGIFTGFTKPTLQKSRKLIEQSTYIVFQPEELGSFGYNKALFGPGFITLFF